MYQMELSLGQVLGRYIVRDGLEVLLSDFLKETNVDIGSRDVAVSSHLPAEPLCYRASSSTNLKNTPSPSHTQHRQPPLGHRV